MRLHDIALVIESQLSKLTFTPRDISHNMGITNFRGAVRAAEAIRATGALTSDADRVLRLTEITRNVHDEAVVSRALFDQFRAAVDNLNNKASALLDGIRSIIEPDSEDQLSVRLPDDDELSEIAETMTELEKALTQAIVNPYIGGEVKVIGFDRGSNWIDLAVHGSAALLVIGQLLRLIVDFQRKQLEIVGKREVVRSLKLQNDIAAAAEKTLEHELASYLEDRVHAIAKTAGAPDSDNEYHERLKFSVRTLSGLVTRGLEVHPSLAAPAATAETFPSPKEVAAALKQLAAPQKAITDVRDESSST